MESLIVSGLNEFEFCAKYGVTPTEAKENMEMLSRLTSNPQLINAVRATNRKQTVKAADFAK